MSLHVFGIRHHGPGCARSLRDALEALQPDIVLVEGPPDAQDVLPLLQQKEMKPPVALLIYAPEQPKQAVYYPFTSFSPEWQAFQYAYKKQIPARFMDLPQAFQFARLHSEEEAPAPFTTNEPTDELPLSTSINEVAIAQPTEQEAQQNHEHDPLALLAEAAGYEDHELWWELQIEQRQNTAHLFEAILEAMTALRGDKPPKDEEEALREAYMRQTIRAAQKEGFQRIAIVCGAWHAPVLTNPGPAKADAALLSGLKRSKVEATWIPWTNSRLSHRSGYGAGVTSPGWYEHLWTTPKQTTIRWMTKAAHLLRKQDLDASSASVIEAVRLAEALAALRDLTRPGLSDLHEAIETILCHGNTEPMQLIREKLEIGEKLGKVPSEAPMVPLQRDLEIQQRKLKLKPSPEEAPLALDLRKENDLARSRLLHRLALLNLNWGKLQRNRIQGSTFHEDWKLEWKVEFVIALIEANIWGNTIEIAASNFVKHEAESAQELPTLTKLLDKTMLAELPAAIDHLLEQIQERAAISADVRHLMDALPPLARVARYGNVRQSKSEQILPIIDGLFERVIISLPIACANLDDDAARQMLSSIDAVQECVSLLNDTEQRKQWQQTLRKLMERESIHGLLRGRCCRLLLEQQVLEDEELQRQTSLALSSAVESTQAAAWIEGVLSGSGLLVIHQDALWIALDRWLCTLSTEQFEALLPVLRRSFASFQSPERRKMGEKVKHLHTVSSSDKITATGTATLNTERAAKVLPLLASIVGGK
ncbi:DUF5682 family protein [Tengunoibacter tsumagoiensis]|uniref:Uncharacterized protein n=1 Tax=Tengunoibacter tsumagoiensis TaxID=2014871 RepID=A0A401ZZL0_9CHLR|nr:DUF5682 family protein [Tengunoibacter tsumagoiensis]GCE12284.1 hypothetical protein KTT_21430 [Tengunoibacter tsumagoiensis]